MRYDAHPLQLLHWHAIERSSSMTASTAVRHMNSASSSDDQRGMDEDKDASPWHDSNARRSCTSEVSVAFRPPSEMVHYSFASLSAHVDA
jgi:hypothetical protein